MSWVDRTRRPRRQGGRSGSPAPASGECPVPSRPVPELHIEGLAADGKRTNGHRVDGFGSQAIGDGCPVDAGPDAADNHPTLPSARGPVLQTIALHEADVVAVVSGAGRFVFVSASAERLLGHDVRDAVGQDAFELFDDDSVAAARSLFDDLIARRRLSVSLELRTVRSDGRHLELELVAANHLADPVGGVVVTLRDITSDGRPGPRTHDVDPRQDALIESLADGVVMVDVAGAIVRVNESFEVMFHAPRTRILGRTLEDVQRAAVRRGLEVFDEHGEVLAPTDHPVLASLRGGRRIDGAVIGYRTGDAPARWIRVNAQPIYGPEGGVIGSVGTVSDITDGRHAAYAIRQEEEFLRVLLDTLDEGIVACDAQGRMTIFNPAARRLHGLDDSIEPIGRVPASRMLRHLDGSPIDPEENPLLLAMSGERLRDVEIILVPSDGDERKVSVNGQALVDEDGWRLGAVVAMHDVTEQKRNEERLADLAHHDPLTGLGNRTLLALRMSEAVDGLGGYSEGTAGGHEGARAPDGDRAHPEHPGIAVYLLDLDDFNLINEDFGHDVGDDLLVAVARRLTALVRPTDTVARLGGDEFVVVCEIESGEEEMLRISERIASALARPYSIDGRTLFAEASVGGVFVDDPDTDPSKLLSLADDAMYGVKWSRRRERRSMMD